MQSYTIGILIMIQSYTNNNAKLYYRYPKGILIMIQSYTNNNAKLY